MKVYKNECLKLKKWPRLLFRSKTNHTCHQSQIHFERQSLKRAGVIKKCKIQQVGRGIYILSIDTVYDLSVKWLYKYL
jgi:hypothetical protein